MEVTEASCNTAPTGERILVAHRWTLETSTNRMYCWLGSLLVPHTVLLYVACVLFLSAVVN